jgi:hypothetical protein
MEPVGKCHHSIGWLCYTGYTAQKLPVSRRRRRGRSNGPMYLIQTRLEGITIWNRHCYTEYEWPIGCRHLPAGFIPTKEMLEWNPWPPEYEEMLYIQPHDIRLYLPAVGGGGPPHKAGRTVRQLRGPTHRYYKVRNILSRAQQLKHLRSKTKKCNTRQIKYINAI